MPMDGLEDDEALLDPDARDIPLRLTRDELMAEADGGWRRDGWRFDDLDEGGG